MDGGFVSKFNFFSVFYFFCLLFSSLKPQMACATNDPYFKNQWYLQNNGQLSKKLISDNQIDFFKGKKGIDINWQQDDIKNISKKSKGQEIIVAIVDTGLDINHPDLKGRIWHNPDCLKKGSKEKNCFGFNALRRNGDVSDNYGHGTHMAGIIAANSNNKIGIAGITSQNVKIMPIKVWDIRDKKQKGFIYNVGKNKKYYVTDLIASAMYFAILKGAKVISISFGWLELYHTRAMRKILKYARDHNVIVVVAAGNDNKEIPIYPCSSDNVICVGELNSLGQVSVSSNYGGQVDLYAPSRNVLSLYPLSNCNQLVVNKNDPCLKGSVESSIFRTPGFEIKRGTSFAQPMVAAAVAMLKVQNKEMSFNQIKSRLLSTARVVKDPKVYGAGLLDIHAVLNSKEIKQFVIPNFKGLFSVQVDKNGEFEFDLPIENLSQEAKNIKIKVHFFRKEVSLLKQKYTIDSIQSNQFKHIKVIGHLNSLDIDSSFKFQIKIEYNKKKYTYNNSIFINRSVVEDDRFLDFKLNINPKDIFRSYSKVNISKLKKVIDDDANSKIGYYFFKSKKLVKNKLIALYSLLAIDVKKKQSNVLSVKLKEGDYVTLILRHDINLDGKKDFLFYGYNKKTGLVFMSFFDDKLSPLFKNNYWIDEEKGSKSFVDKTSKEVNVAWIKVKTNLFNTIAIPSILSFSAELNNDAKSGDLLDDFTFKTKGHIFYPYPSQKLDKQRIRISWKALDNYKFIKDFTNKFNIDLTNNIYISNMKQVGLNISESILNVGTGNVHQVFKLRRENQSISIDKLDTNFKSLVLNTWDSIRDQNGVNLDIFTAPINRTKMRVFIPENQSFNLIQSDQWSDPLVNYEFSFIKDDQILTMIESRFYLYLFDQFGLKHKVPIMRESSLSDKKQNGESEYLLPLKNTKSKSVLVNSSRLMGKLIYTIKYDKKALNDSQSRFFRPVNYNFYLTNRCASIEKVMEVNKSSYLSFLCYDGKNTIRLRTIKIP